MFPFTQKCVKRLLRDREQTVKDRTTTYSDCGLNESGAPDVIVDASPLGKGFHTELMAKDSVCVYFVPVTNHTVHTHSCLFFCVLLKVHVKVNVKSVFFNYG